MGDDRAPLTSRQREVLRLLAEGEGAPQIATALGLGLSTVRRHIRSALDKLGTPRPPAAAATNPSGPAHRMIRSRIGVSPIGPTAVRATGDRTLGRHVAQAVRAHGSLAVLALVKSNGTALPFEPPAAPTSPVVAPADLERTHLSGHVPSLRRDDFVITWRDQTLVILLPGSDLLGAEAVARRLRGDGRTAQYAIGAAQWRPGEGPGALVARAQRGAGFDLLNRQAARSLTRAIRKR